MMIKSPVWLLFAVALLIACVSAQRTIVVDAQNGPGTHFLDVPPAVSFAAPGDRIIVRAGYYTPPTIDKGLTILFETNAYFGWFFATTTIANLPANETVTLRGVQFHPQHLGRLEIRQCAGHVSLENMSSWDLSFQSSSSLTAVGCTVIATQPLSVRGGHVVLSRCFLRAGSSNPAIDATDASVWLQSCTIHGAFFGGSRIPPGHGVVLVRSILQIVGTLAEPTTIAGGVAGFLQTSSSVVATDSDVIYDSRPGRVLFPDGIVSNRTPRRRALPALIANEMLLGQLWLVTVESGAGESAAVLAGVPSGPSATSFGVFWLDLRTSVVLGVGTLDSNGIAVLAVPVPQVSALRGASIGTQAIVLLPSGLEFTPPSHHTIDQ